MRLDTSNPLKSLTLSITLVLGCNFVPSTALGQRSDPGDLTQARLEVSVVGQHLLSPRHAEFPDEYGCVHVAQALLPAAPRLS